jgi:hypothetical protein
MFGKLVVTCGLGGIILIMGFMIAFLKKIQLVHGYHYKYVAEEKRAIFCLLVGLGIMVAGLGLMLMGLLSIQMGKTGDLIGIVMLFAGIIFSALVIGLMNNVNQMKEHMNNKKRP